jgi:hypothetical protein
VVESLKEAQLKLKPQPLSDRATLHQQTVDGVDWVVIKDSLDNVISSYPTGGNPTNF